MNCYMKGWQVGEGDRKWKMVVGKGQWLQTVWYSTKEENTRMQLSIHPVTTAEFYDYRT